MEFIREHQKQFIIACVVVLVMIVFSVGYYGAECKNPNIHRGVKVDNVNVSGLTKEEAIQTVTAQKEQEGKQVIAFVDPTTKGKEKSEEKGVSYSLSLNDLGFHPDIAGEVEQAFQFGRSGSTLENFWNIVTASFFHRNFQSKVLFEENKLNEMIAYLAEKVHVLPANAYISTTEDDQMVLHKEELGKYLDINEMKKLLAGDLLHTKEIILPVYTQEPQIKEEYFQGIDKLLASFTTDYSSSEKNRKSNIAIAAETFNDMLIKPGQTISFNTEIGDITPERGYKNAGVIVNGEFDRGMGGGMCQVSTTLYNAVVRADLEIVERYNHSRPISYVPLGTDAAVAQGYKDFQFKNNTNHAVYIKSVADNQKLTFKIFGNSADRNYTIQLDPKLLSVVQPNVIKKYTTSLSSGDTTVEKSGAKGYSYRTYKEKVENGQVVERTELNTSYYIPQDRVVLIGEGSSKDDDSSDDSTSKKSSKSNNKEERKSSKFDEEKSSKSTKSSKKTSKSEKNSTSKTASSKTSSKSGKNHNKK